MERVALAAQVLAAAAICFMAVAVTLHVHEERGTCLTADGEGGCGAKAPDP
jgi:hypothetical protein